MMAAYSLREKPRSITNGAVIAPDSASVNLNSTTKASARKAKSRDRNSEKAPTAASMTRLSDVSRAWTALAATDFSGSVAHSVVTMPISTNAAITTYPARHAA